MSAKYNVGDLVEISSSVSVGSLAYITEVKAYSLTETHYYIVRLMDQDAEIPIRPERLSLINKA